LKIVRVKIKGHAFYGLSFYFNIYIDRKEAPVRGKLLIVNWDLAHFTKL